MDTNQNVTPTSTTSSTNAPVSNNSGSKGIIVLLTVIVLILFAALAAGAVYFMNAEKRDNIEDMNNGSRITPIITEEAQLTETETPTTFEPMDGIGTEFDQAKARIDRVYRSNSGLIVNFTIYCPDGQGATCGPLAVKGDKPDRYGVGEEGINSNYDIWQSYLVDENSLKKYEVLKDASGKYLATEPLKVQPFLRGEEQTFTVTFTNPPAEVDTITLNITGLQAVPGVKI